MSILLKFKNNLWRVTTFIPSLFFNLRHLPFKQAIRLPIIIHKATLAGCNGKFIIRCKPRYGLVHLGKNMVCIYPGRGITLENRGKMIFNGPLKVGNDSAISVGPSGILEFGSDVAATAALKLVCYHSVKIDSNVLIGWNCMILDTDFHKPTYLDGRKVKSYGPVCIGSATWIANGCKIYKDTRIAERCVIGADTILSRKTIESPCTLVATKREYLVRGGEVWLDRAKEQIEYPSLDS